MAIGRCPELSCDAEKQLASCIKELCDCGVSPRAEDILGFVQIYVQKNGLTTCFTDGKPGRDWLSRFTKRNNLVKKKPTFLSNVRTEATANPFTVYDAYDKLERLMEKESFAASQVCVCSCICDYMSYILVYVRPISYLYHTCLGVEL